MAQDEKNNKLKFTVVQDEHFIDLNLYQFGWEKCDRSILSGHISAIIICFITSFPGKAY